MTTSLASTSGAGQLPRDATPYLRGGTLAARLAGTRLPPDVLLLGAMLIANCAWAAIWPGPFTAGAALLLWLIAIARLCVADPRALVMFLPFIVLHFSVVLSLGAIEAGAYMKEMGSRGHASTASASYVLFSLLFMLSAELVCRWPGRRERHGRETSDAAHRPLILVWAALAIAAPIVVYLFLAGLRNGFPLLTGTDRFAYRMTSADVLTLNFLNLKFVIAALLGSGAAFAATALRRNCHHLTLLAYLLVSFLFGDKFFIILIAAGFYAMPFVICGSGDARRVIVRITPYALLVLCCVCAVTMFIYSDYGRLDISQTMARLGERAAGQGQLWYLAVRDSSHAIGIDTKLVADNLSSLLANPHASFVFEHRLGPFYFVEKYSPSDVYSTFIHNSGAVTPTMVFEAYGLIAFGYVGLAFLMVGMGVLVGVLVSWLARGMASGNPFNVLLPAFAFTQAVSLMAQATLYSLVGLSAWKAYAAFLVLQLGVAQIVKPWLVEQSRKT